MALDGNELKNGSLSTERKGRDLVRSLSDEAGVVREGIDYSDQEWISNRLEQAAREIDGLLGERGSWQGLLSAALDDLDALDDTGASTAYYRKRAWELIAGV